MPNHPRVETLICPMCECQRSRVRQTTTTEYKHKGRVYVHIRRKRLCDHCGHYFTTLEMTESAEVPGTPQVFVEDRHPIDKSYAPKPKPAPPRHPLDDDPPPADPLHSLKQRDQIPTKQPPSPSGCPLTSADFIVPPSVVMMPPGFVAPAVAAQSLSSPEKPPQAGRRKNPYSSE